MRPHLPATGLCALLVLATACTPAAPSSLLPGATASSAPTGPAVTEPISISAIQRLDASVGFVAGRGQADGFLAKTSDGGASWQRLAQPATFVTALRFIDERVGWAVAFAVRNVQSVGCASAALPGALPCRGLVLRTEDGGRTWQETLSIPTDGVRGDPIGQLQAVDGQRAWALVFPPSPCALDCPAELRRTTDGGKTWTTLFRDGIAAIRFASASRGWMALADPPGSAEVRVTSDGGTTWTAGFGTTSGGPVGLDAATVQTAWLMTRDGASCTSSGCLTYQLFRTDDGGRTWSKLGNPGDSAGGCAFGHLHGPLFASPARGWLALNLGAGGAAGGPGGLLATEDGGKTWRCSSTPPTTLLVSAADTVHVWATSEGPTRAATLYSTDDGGRAWRALDLSRLE